MKPEFSWRLFDRKTLLLLAGVLLSLSYLAPNHETPWLSFHVEILAAIAGVLFVSFALSSPKAKVSRIPTSVVFLLLVSLIPLFQWGAGLIAYRGDAVLASMYIACTAVMIWAGFVIRLDDSVQLSHVIALSLLWAAILSTGAAIYQRIFLDGWSIYILNPDRNARSTANLGQPNHLATLLMMGIAAVIWLWTERRLSKWTAGLASGFLSFGVALTGSRQPFLGVLILAAWSLRADSLKNVKLRVWSGLVVLVFWLAAAFIAAENLPSLFDAPPVVENSRFTVGLRPLMWEQFAHAIVNAPWLGYGWQGGLTAQASVAVEHPGLEFAAYAHDILIDLLIWNGIPLGAVLIVSLAIWYFKVGRSVRNQGGWFEFALITLLLAHSLVEYPFAYCYFLVPVALAAGRLEAQNRLTRRRMPFWVLAGVNGVLALTTVIIVSDYLSIATERRELITWKARIGGDHPLPSISETWVLDQLAASIEWLRADPVAGMTPVQISRQMKLSKRYPTVALQARTALVLGLNGQSTAAYIELLRLRGLEGDRFFRMAVAEVRSLAATQQSLQSLVKIIDSNASKLPPLPLIVQGGVCKPQASAAFFETGANSFSDRLLKSRSKPECGDNG